MANLTQQEFLNIADLYPGEVNIWCTESDPVQVLGVTIPFRDNESNNVESTLEQVQTITLPVDNDTNSTVELLIISRVIRGIAPSRYYFFIVQNREITPYISPTDNEQIQDGRVLLLPNLRGGSFYVSEYNVTLNTAQNNRVSDYILQRTSNTFAAVQDSLYSDTGWINARYEGSNTNSQTYSSIDSAILGSSFQGTYYPIQTPDVEINNIDVSERSYLEYFHTSTKTYPSYSIETPPLFSFAQTSASPSASFLIVNPDQAIKPFKQYQPGDLLKLETGTEVLKVNEMYRINTQNQYALNVTRGWGDTVRQVISVDDYFFKINSIRIFELEGNKPSPVKQGKIRIKDTGYIVYTDLLGYVISGSMPTLI
jgi:hypothetical protein